MAKIIYKIANKLELTDALNLLENRYLEAGYINESQKDVIYEDPYINNSKYFVAKDGAKVVGVIRLVFGQNDELPVFNEFILDSVARGKTNKLNGKILEIGHLAAIPGRRIAPGLYRIAIQYALKHGYTYLVAGIDHNLFNRLKKKYPPLKPFYMQIAEPKFYVGSNTVPILLKINPIMLLFL